jgi:hypothetical protein
VLETLAKDKHSSLWGSLISKEVQYYCFRGQIMFAFTFLMEKVKKVNITLGGSPYLRLKLERFLFAKE